MREIPALLRFILPTLIILLGALAAYILRRSNPNPSPGNLLLALQHLDLPGDHLCRRTRRYRKPNGTGLPLH